jgi:hypothetical protein
MKEKDVGGTSPKNVVALSLEISVPKMSQRKELDKFGRTID